MSGKENNFPKLPIFAPTSAWAKNRVQGRFWRSARILKGNDLNFSKSKKNLDFDHPEAVSGPITYSRSFKNKKFLFLLTMSFFLVRGCVLCPENASGCPKSGFFSLLKKFRSFPFKIRADLQNRPTTRFFSPG